MSKKRGPVSPKANLTPMIDVIFQLLIFFLIISKIVTDHTVKLAVPSVFDSQTMKLEDEAKSLILTAYHSSYVTDAGVDQTTERQKIRNTDLIAAMLDTDGLVDSVNISIGENYRFEGGNGKFFNAKTGQSLAEVLTNVRSDEQPVILRADMSARYSEVGPLLPTLLNAEYEDVHLVAYIKEN